MAPKPPRYSPPRGAAPPVRTPRPRYQIMIVTGAFAAAIIAGSIYGAGLKTQQEFKEEKRRILEAPPEVRLRELEARRADLARQAAPIERKLETHRAEMRAAAAAAAEAKAGGGDDGRRP
ncbi:hypothetical protein GGR56DRAFT_674901 [Xylariaceae sp. FL0804]|nr:hypothetical protein GGR56DRAFT_674901 [Xylariaceae sp. FL0804]